MRCLAIGVEFEHPAWPRTTQRIWIDAVAALILRVDQIQMHTKEAHELATRRDIEAIEACTGTPGVSYEMRAELLAQLRDDLAQDFQAFRMETTTTFRPRLNVPIDDAEFEFTPPEGP